ncbi:hypothetical protein GUJ93_ZPchr0013g34503 [Zizania palustris]|uniref:Uncharacterized protein n=1 Tax=Zizania palustris TaxID=103762 RepID=A0A8J6C2U7_ZIZPA|nr:hypothetical protein GUJ93_ZPchr0013g34503 [Zizania palustris]KAG8098022.1 hypothetical protein GUJ93_ZPchr0013g34503 [Zizania palustris]KAG8098023.1 hypothetical protein GUJ93_ZPchr0013g34503 [Zizania palustris]
MLRQSSSRNYRSKGLKLKKALQITLLVLVSVWLIYQVKHSYEKKAYNENETNEPHKDDQNEGEMIRLGRKDLPTKMEADSSTLDERIEDEENEEMEQEMKHDENDEDPIDEPDLDKDDDLPENGEHSAGKDEGSEDVGVFEDEEPKERSQEDQEKTFHGDNVSSAVSHDPLSLERDELPHLAQEKILYVDDASTAVPHDNQEAEHREAAAREAREKTFKGDDVSSSVDHDAEVTNPLPEEQLKSMDRIFEGTTNLSNGILSFRGTGVNESNAAGELGSSQADVYSHPNTTMHSTVSESKADTAPVNLISNHTGSDQTNSTSLKGQQEQQVNSTAVLNNQIQLFTDLTSASPPNGTVALASTDAEKATSVDRDHDGNTGTSSTLVNNRLRKEIQTKTQIYRQKS